MPPSKIERLADANQNYCLNTAQRRLIQDEQKTNFAKRTP
jgi:hypothetical protein